MQAHTQQQTSRRPNQRTCFAAVLLLLQGSVSLAQLTPASLPDSGAARHLQAASRHAQGSATLKAAQKKWCAPAPADAALAQATQRLQAVEASFQQARESDLPRSKAQWTSLVIERECAAFQEASLAGSPRRPVWWFSDLKIISARENASHTMTVRARASSPDGPVVNSRITFARGLHMACFANTDAQGIAQCDLADTHPHGLPGDDDELDHQGDLIATLAGLVSTSRVSLPAVTRLTFPATRSRKHAP